MVAQTHPSPSTSGENSMAESSPEMERQEGTDATDPETQYGLGSWRPASLRRFSTLWSFVGLYVPCAILKVSIIQYTRTQVSAIEDHFRINSSKAGFLISAVDIGSVAFALVGAHFGRFMHIPRLLAASAVVAGVAVMSISVVQIAKPRSLPSDPTILRFGSIQSRKEQKLLNELCWTQATAERFQLPFNISHDFSQLENFIHLYRDENYDSASGELPWTYFWTMGALIVAGAVMSYKLALQTYHVEHNVKDANQSGKYIGVLQAAMVFGSPVALFLGAFIHQVPVDVEDTSMSTSDPRWVSAWWLGYVIIGFLLALLAIPVFPLPRRIAGSRYTQEHTLPFADSEAVSSDQTHGSTHESSPPNFKRPQSYTKHQRHRPQNQTNGQLLNHHHHGHPRYNSNDHSEPLTQNSNLPFDYMSDDESSRFLYDKLTGDQRRYLSCQDLYHSERLDLSFSDLQNILHAETEKKTVDKDLKLAGLYTHRQPFLSNGKDPYYSPFHPKAEELSYPKGDNQINLTRNNSVLTSPENFNRNETGAENVPNPDDSKLSLNHKLKSWPQSLKRLLRNPVIVLMVIEGAFFYVGLLGPIAFQLKYIEDQFDESASKISLYLGIGQLSTAVAGTYLGGYLTSRFSLSRVEMFKASLGSQFTALLLSSCFVFLGCDNHEIIGLNKERSINNSEECLCANNSILFLCGSDGRNYLSPCVAGCQDIDNMDYRNCTQIQWKGTASPGFCDNGCHTFYPLLLVYVLLIFTATLGFAPRTLMVCRSVAVEDESLANGLVNGFVLRCAAIGGPILFGQLYDNTCLLWPHDNGSCKISDKDDLRKHFQGTGILLRAIGTSFFLAATVLVCLKDREARKQAREAQSLDDDGG